MPATDNQGSFLNRISIRRNQFMSMDTNHDQELEDLELFQKHVADRFADLLFIPTTSDTTTTDPPGEDDVTEVQTTYVPPPPPPLLSVSWFRYLLDTFLLCEAEFKAVLVSGRDPSQFSKPPLDRLIPDLLERSVKALDVCNAMTHGVDLIQQWLKLGLIAVAALQQSPIGEGQVRRARKALITLLTSMAFDDREYTNNNHNNNNNASHGKSTDRSWSFGRRGNNNSSSSNSHKDRIALNFKSYNSWPSVSKTWSASKIIQNMSSNLVLPRGAESNSLAVPVYIMSIILVLVMWALVAAIPCQERNGLSMHLQIPRNLTWAQPIISLQEKIGEDWKKKEKKGCGGLLEEVQRIEKAAHAVLDATEDFEFPMEEEKAAELAAQVAEMVDICEKMQEGLGPLQQQIREVFHRIVRSRAEVFDVLDQISKSSNPVPY